jgi:hypothetical protein
MPITKQAVAEKLLAYLRHETSLSGLVDWAETAVMDAEFDPDAGPELVSAVARLGVADVRAFGLTWEDCQALLQSLGYDARVELVRV